MRGMTANLGRRCGLWGEGGLCPPVVWPNGTEPGSGYFERNGHTWPYTDFRGRILLDGVIGQELAARLGLQPGDQEGRQCVVLNAVATVLWAKAGDPGIPPGVVLAAALWGPQLCVGCTSEPHTRPWRLRGPAA